MKNVIGVFEKMKNINLNYDIKIWRIIHLHAVKHLHILQVLFVVSLKGACRE